MKKITFIFLLLSTFCFGQETTTNIGLDTLSTERNEIIHLWKKYLNSKPYQLNNNPNWLEADKKVYKSYDLLRSEGFIQPSIYHFQLDNKILSITKNNDDYIIKSAFINKENLDIFAIINVVATKQNGKFILTNYQKTLTQNWSTKTVGSITYHYFPEYQFNEENALKANEFINTISSTFDLKNEKINYFICKDCDDVYKTKGFDYVFTMGNSTECGFFDSYNNIIYATQLAGENHQHELTHVINKYFPKANDLLLIGLSAYFGEENSHNGKPILYHIKRVNDYLKAHPEVDLNKPNEFWKLDNETNPQYVIGSVLCDLIIKKGGIPLLKEFLNSGKSIDDFLRFIELKLNLKKTNLNDYLRKNIEEISKKIAF